MTGIAFTYVERYRAQRVVRAILQGTVLEAAWGEFLAWRALPAGAVELIDAASFPQAPSGPNRLLVAMLGLLAGLAGGVFWWRGMTKDRRSRAGSNAQRANPIERYSAVFSACSNRKLSVFSVWM